jgi:hypothetical protein
VGEFQVNLRERMAGIDANLDDVQAGAEACSRAADTIVADTANFDGLLKTPRLRLLLRHVNELQAGVRDQRSALEELRDSVAQLRDELKVATRRRHQTAVAGDSNQRANRR